MTFMVLAGRVALLWQHSHGLQTAIDMPFRMHMRAAAQHGVVILVSMTVMGEDCSGLMVVVAQHATAGRRSADGAGSG